MVVGRKSVLFGILGATALVSAGMARTDVDHDEDDAKSTAEASTRGATYYNRLNEGLSNLERLHDKAAKKRNILKDDCIAPQLMLARGHKTVAEASFAELNAAVQRNDVGAASHYMKRLLFLQQKVVVLNTVAETCVGGEAGYTGETTVEVDIDDAIPKEDPTEWKFNDPDVTRPPPASPFV
jgi:hypothetical protein